MKTTICLILLSAAAGIAGAQTTTPAAPAAKMAKTKAKPKPIAVTPPLKIPTGAVKIEDGSYRWTDPHGKVWLYRDTPFGVSRNPEVAANAAGTNVSPFGVSKPTSSTAPAAAAIAGGDPNEHVTAAAHGDIIRFEQPTPFGSTVWEKKANELTPDERKIWDREQAKRKQ